MAVIEVAPRPISRVGDGVRWDADEYDQAEARFSVRCTRCDAFGFELGTGDRGDHLSSIVRGAHRKRAKTGCAISAAGRTRPARRRLVGFIDQRRRATDLDAWRRGRAVLGYIRGRRVVDLASEADVTRGSVNRWLRRYETQGTEGLLTGVAPGPRRRLTAAQQSELSEIIEAGPQAAGYSTGVWTGPMIGDLIHTRFGVRYHNHHVPRLLHALGFSVQRPRKKLARADARAQARWLRDTLPAIKKKRVAHTGS